MDKQLSDVLNNKSGNYIFPFFWQHGDHHDRITEQIERIASTGVKAFCVEARPHKDFLGDSWWSDMDLILAEAEKRDMKVWLLDDDHFPSGHCSGMLENGKNDDLRSKSIVEKHMDIAGPMKGATVFVKPFTEDDTLISCRAYKRIDGERTEREGIDLMPYVKNNRVVFDCPEGVYRVFAVFITRRFTDHYIDMLRPESVKLFLDTNYESHYARYKKYFGTTFAGFFSDEPRIGNGMYNGNLSDRHYYYNITVGVPGVCMPYTEDIITMMEKDLGFDPIPYLNSLWYEADGQEEIRCAFMNAVTNLYSTCFTQQIGNWCRAHGVEYIGHIIEDGGAHCRFGCSAGHYFRAEKGQDMSGIDIVLHQIVPGFIDFDNAASIAPLLTDRIFYNYALGQLAASDAHLDKTKKGRAMCEVFGAYGWAEGTPMMKWLTDFLLVRGINHFVPHAFSPAYPDPDCPPHFGAEGHDPQFEGFKVLMNYMNKAAHLLYGADFKAQAAILYHAEEEWANDINGHTYIETIGKKLYDNHILYDFVSLDVLKTAHSKRDGKLYIGDRVYEKLIVPSADVMPKSVSKELFRLCDEGVELITADDETEVQNEFIPQVKISGKSHLLRHFYGTRGNDGVYMFSNESTTETADFTVDFVEKGRYFAIDILGGKKYSGSAKDAHFVLCPYDSIIVFVGNDVPDAPKPFTAENSTEIKGKYKISLASSENLDEFKFLEDTSTLMSITEKDGLDEFSGKIRYNITFTAEKHAKDFIDLGEVGVEAQLILNGKDLSHRIAPPYMFDVSEALLNGENEMTIIVSNTLANKVADDFSNFLAIPRSGLFGPVTLKY